MATREEIRTLAELQKRDSAIDLLTHKRAGLPERKSLAETEEILVKAGRLLDQTKGQLDLAQREQKRLEDEIAALNDKIAKEEKLLYGGTITGSKELQNLQAEIASLKKRADDLETELLSAMEKVDAVQGKVDQIEAKKAELEAKKASLEKAIADQEEEIDSELEDLGSEREDLAAELPAAELSRYEKLRASKAGIAIAHLLDDGICSGCRKELPATELAAYRKVDDLYPCPHCRRLIVPHGG